MIELFNIKKEYRMGSNIVTALNNVNLVVDDGEFISIVGPSGSGKSTLMNVIGCLDIADSGTYLLDSSDVSTLSEFDLGVIRNKKIGFIFQQFNLLMKLNAYENVELPLIYQGMNGANRKKRVVEALTRVGLEDRMDHRPNELSGGQQQRVAIARALATKPTLILADEPTGNLDQKSGKEIMVMLTELHNEGNGIVLITHDDETASVAERQVKIVDGQITYDSKNNLEKEESNEV